LTGSWFVLVRTGLEVWIFASTLRQLAKVNETHLVLGDFVSLWLNPNDIGWRFTGTMFRVNQTWQRRLQRPQVGSEVIK